MDHPAEKAHIEERRKKIADGARGHEPKRQEEERERPEALHLAETLVSSDVREADQIRQEERRAEKHLAAEGGADARRRRDINKNPAKSHYKWAQGIVLMVGIIENNKPRKDDPRGERRPRLIRPRPERREREQDEPEAHHPEAPGEHLERRRAPGRDRAIRPVLGVVAPIKGVVQEHSPRVKEG